MSKPTPVTDAMTAELPPATPVANGRHSAIPNRRLPSDDFEVEVDGQTFRPHAGEWVEVGATRTLRQMKFLEDSTAAVEGEANTEYFARFWGAMVAGGVYLVGWNWTSAGRPLPPVETPDVWMDLTTDEIIYLIRTVLGGVAGQGPFAQRLRGYAAWLTGKGPQPPALLLDALAQRWGCPPSAVLEEDAALVGEILEASSIEAIFRTAGKDWSDSDREVWEQLLDAAPDRATRAAMLSRHAKASGET